MLDDLQYGSRNKRGDWQPNEPISLPPIVKSPNSAGVFGWLLGLIWPWNLITIGLTALLWFFVIPPVETMQTLSASWITPLFVVNWVALFVWLGAWEVVLYNKRSQERRFKYNNQFPAEKPMEYFWFKNQNLDNFLRSMFISVPIMVALEVFALWMFANGLGAISFAVESPLLFVIALLFIPVFHEAYFFFAHWFMHWEPFYKWCHAIHHNSINPSPWTSMSNHPLESFLQFAPALLWMPLTPFLVIYHLNTVAFSSIIGHIGFDKIEIGETGSWDSHAYAHYLHHKHFEVNYCDNGYLPWDKWFGTWHDGTKEGEKLMRERFKAKVARKNA